MKPNYARKIRLNSTNEQPTSCTDFNVANHTKNENLTLSVDPKCTEKHRRQGKEFNCKDLYNESIESKCQNSTEKRTNCTEFHRNHSKNEQFYTNIGPKCTEKHRRQGKNYKDLYNGSIESKCQNSTKSFHAYTTTSRTYKNKDYYRNQTIEPNFNCNNRTGIDKSCMCTKIKTIRLASPPLPCPVPCEIDFIQEIQNRINSGLCGSYVPKISSKYDYMSVKKETSDHKYKLNKHVTPKKRQMHKTSTRTSKNRSKPPRNVQVSKKPIIVVESHRPNRTSTKKRPPIRRSVLYRLSNKKFIDLGWTHIRSETNRLFTLPTTQCTPHYRLLNEWKQKSIRRTYSNRRVMIDVGIDGNGHVYYPNGDVAIRIKTMQNDAYRVVIYFRDDHCGMGKRLKKGKRVAAMFDSYGHGVVYNTEGNYRLLYNQSEGTLFDIPRTCSRLPRAPLYWTWRDAPYVEQRKQLLGAQCATQLSPFRTPARASDLAPHKMMGRKRAKVNNKQKMGGTAASGGKEKKAKTTMSRLTLSMTNTSNVSLKTKLSTYSKISSVQGSPPPATPDIDASTLTSAPSAAEFPINMPEYHIKLPTAGEETKAHIPVRIVLQIQRGLNLVILEQCRVKLKFQYGRNHLTLQLGVKVDFNAKEGHLVHSVLEDMNQPQHALRNMFSVYKLNSKSLHRLIQS